MKVIALLSVILALSISVLAQSGRRSKTAPPPTPTPEATPVPSPTPALPSRVSVTAEKDQDYGCTSDGTLAHLLDKDVAGLSPKEVDIRAEITAKPDALYTREARRAGIQGMVVLKALLLPEGKLDRLRVIRRLPYGLTENAIRAACEIKFKPAVKAGKQVPQWVTLEYAFRLANSSIFGP